MNNSFGSSFTITSWGESHGPAIGVVIDGCPSGILLSEEDFIPTMNRRRPGKKFVSPRKETDAVSILSGVYLGKTTGAPISLQIKNMDAQSSSYKQISHIYRPGHADLAYQRKYQHFDPLGGGRASARETACRCAAGVIANKILSHHNIQTLAFLSRIGPIQLHQDVCFSESLQSQTYNSPIFCPDLNIASQMEEYLSQIIQEGDSIGGVVSFTTSPIQQALGEPIFRKIEALLASAMMSIPASKGFEIGTGFEAAQLKGSEYTDSITLVNDVVELASNQCGGTLGGITVGQPLNGKVAFKPTSSIKKNIPSITKDNKETTFQFPKEGRHDACVAIRAVPVVEAMLNIVLADLVLQNTSSANI